MTLSGYDTIDTRGLRRLTFTMLISNRTESVLAPIESKTSLSTSPVGNGVGGAGEVARGAGEDAKSLGIGGRCLDFAGDAEEGEESSAAVGVAEGVVPFNSVDFVPSASTV